MSRLRSLLVRILLLVVVALICFEGVLQIASFFTESRSVVRGDSSSRVVLCVGDSHTYGALVIEGESYPAHLQRALDAEKPGAYSVINLGVPGMSSTQVNRRLKDQVDRYDPDVVVIWAGVNDSWNTAESEKRRSFGDRIDALLQNLRAYRMLKIWQHDLRLDQAVAAEVRDHGIRQEAAHYRAEGGIGTMTVLRHGEVVDTIDSRRPPKSHDEVIESENVVYSQHRASVEWLTATGLPAILIRYPLDVDGFVAANRAIERVAADLGVGLVDARESLSRVPAEQIEWLPGAHPNGPMYRAIAADVAALVLELDEPQASRAGAIPASN